MIIIIIIKRININKIAMTGDIANVEGTLFDFRQPILLQQLTQIPGPPAGYDLNFCLGEDVGEKFLAGTVEHAGTGRRLDVFTNQPGLQLYTSNFLDGLAGKDGAIYRQHSSLCLETQNYPDAMNHVRFSRLAQDCIIHLFCVKLSTIARLLL